MREDHHNHVYWLCFPHVRPGKLARCVWAGWGFLGDVCAKRFRNMYFYYHIRVLLVKTKQMIYICFIKYGGTTCVLAVGDNELGIGDDEDASSEAAEGRGTHGRTLRDHVVGLGLVMCKVSVAASRLQVSERTQALAGGTCAKNWFNFIFDCHIRILLIKTNSMIYNMLYKI